MHEDEGIRYVFEDEALDYVLGYTLSNDVSVATYRETPLKPCRSPSVCTSWLSASGHSRRALMMRPQLVRHRAYPGFHGDTLP